MHPLTAAEMGGDFDLARALRFGTLPAAVTHDDPAAYLRSYAATYLREEVQQEGIARNIASFARFLETASFSQASVLNVAAVARECGVQAKVAHDWFQILEDLLVAVRVPVFTRRAKRRMTSHPKFFLFDAGVFRAIRPRGPLDPAEQIDGAALETLFLQHLRAVNDARALGYAIHTWRTLLGDEVDFVLYGERGLRAFEVQRSSRVRPEDLAGLRKFLTDYPAARATLLHTGTRRWHESGVDVVPFAECVADLEAYL
jgi:predicted AAA+ superfamily ATPase